jgi:hypothetical protein
MVALLVAWWFIVVVFSACFYKRGLYLISDRIAQGASKIEVPCAIKILQMGALIIWPQL